LRQRHPRIGQNPGTIDWLHATLMDGPSDDRGTFGASQTTHRQSERHVARQRELVAELHNDGHDTLAARELLERFEDFQELHIAGRNRLQHQAQLAG
jgi:hypothetical protein